MLVVQNFNLLLNLELESQNKSIEVIILLPPKRVFSSASFERSRISFSAEDHKAAILNNSGNSESDRILSFCIFLKNISFALFLSLK